MRQQRAVMQQNQQQENQNPQQGQSDSNMNQQSPEEENEMNKEDAEQLLQIVDREDQRVQEKLKKSTGKKKKPEKDW